MSASICDTSELTPREQEVINLVACGNTARTIARELELSPATVDRHVENIRHKLNSKNRVHMIAQALQLGLLQV